MIIRTPVRRLHWLEPLVGRPVWVKLEHQQHSGSFKYRGALAALMQLPTGTKVITASAGNHALALAEVAHITGHSVMICLPHNASLVKRERLARFDVAVKEHGDGLDEASEYARRVAQAHGWHFISPYNDTSVIAGQASLGLEFLQQVPDMRVVVLPVGGGGLATGTAIAAKGHSPPICLVGCQPQVFAPMAETLRAGGRAARQAYWPSLADGLMVNLNSDAITVDVCRQSMECMVRLTEEELAAGVMALLQRESLLVEASGAIGVAAVLAKKLPDLPGAGPLGVVLSGGNITADALSRIITFPYRSPRLRKMLYLQGRNPNEEINFRGFELPATEATSTDETDEAWMIAQRLAGIGTRLADSDIRRGDFLKICAGHGLEVTVQEQTLYTTVRDWLGTTKAKLERTAGAMSSFSGHGRERLERSAYQALSFLEQLGTWQSPSYGQSLAPGFMRLAAQRSAGVNYSRYGSLEVAEAESQMLSILGFSSARAALLLTSSGMAAFTLLEAFLIRHVLKPGDVVLVPPYLYFEADEQLCSLPGIHVQRVAGHDAGQFLETVRRVQPKVVFIDPMTNTVDLRLTDIRRILSDLRDAVHGACWVVVDGTMVSGAFDPFAEASENDGPEVLYYESGSKYLQLGLDLTLVGLVAVPVRYRAVLERLRRNTGTILYPAQASLLPRFDRELYLTRMRRMTRNALLIGHTLCDTRGVCGEPGIETIFPGLPSHIDYPVSAYYGHLGGIITFRLSPSGLNQRNLLNAYIEHALTLANEQGIALTKGVSFGFSVPRLSAASAMAENSPPFLRLSVGDQDDEATHKLASILDRAFRDLVESLATWSAPPRPVDKL